MACLKRVNIIHKISSSIQIEYCSNRLVLEVTEVKLCQGFVEKTKRIEKRMFGFVQFKKENSIVYSSEERDLLVDDLKHKEFKSQIEFSQPSYLIWLSRINCVGKRVLQYFPCEA